MEDLETNLFQTRKARRIEQMVARWLRRSRDSISRGRSSVVDVPSDGLNQPVTQVKLTVTVHKDLLLGHYGFEISPNPPLTITSVAAGSTADGKLLPGDHILMINNEAVEDISIEQAADLLRELEDSLLLTVLRCTSGGPKSSFLTAEKRARLKTNPVKVRFAEEVLVNGHTQGNALLCVPNVLKVYLENGQTKAFKFDTTTTVKDIILTLKEKLSIQSIEYFALALEEQYNISKLYLLHEDELIEQVVQRKDSHDYRCLFRVCFIPKDPLDLLQEDPVTFEYLYLQSCSDVLQERFAVEMKCSMALRLAALHIQERIYACAQPQKVSFKYIEKDWGIENFISPTLLRNMKGKDIKKAISFHMKRNQILLDPRQKHVLSATQVRLSYLQILGDLKMYSGKIFNATLMLQDRESYVALLVGAKYGISQIINNKLNIITPLAEFANISRLELTEESEKASMVKIYLQDVKLLTLMLESNSAKDLACLIAGYYRLCVDSGTTIFMWGEAKQQAHRISTEEGYESRACSDSEDSWELDSSAERFLDPPWLNPSSIQPLCEEEAEQEELPELEPESRNPGSRSDVTDSASEASDSANTESRGCKTSGSSDSMDALEEDDLEACSSSRSQFLQFFTPTIQELSCQDKSIFALANKEGSSGAESEDFLCFLQLSQGSHPVPKQTNPEQRGENEAEASALKTKLSEENVMEYYSLCSSISPGSNGERSILNHSPGNGSVKDLPAESGQQEGLCKVDPTVEENDLILQPPPGFGDTSSEDEFYDAADRLTPTDALAGSEAPSREGKGDSCFLKKSRCCNLGESCMSRQATREKHRKEKELKHAKSLRKRRSFLQTDYTSQVTFPVASSPALESTDPACCSEREPQLPSISLTHMTSSLDDTTGEPPLLEARTFAQLKPRSEVESKNPLSAFMEMEPDAMETKSVTASVIPSVSASHLQGDQEGKETLDLTPLPSCAENRLGPLGSACARDGGCVSPSEISFHLGDIREPEQAGGAWDSPGGCGHPFSEMEVGCITRTVPREQPMPQSAAEALETHRELEPSAHPGEGGIPPCAEPVLSPLGCYRGKPLPQAAASDLDSLSTADKGEACEQLVPSSPFARGTAGPTSCAVKPDAEMVSGEINNKNLNEEPLKRVEDKSQLGFSNATELLSDFNGASGIITRLSWLSFGTRTDQAIPCQQGDIEDAPPADTDQAVDQSPWTAKRSDSGALRKETHFSSVSPKVHPPPERLSGQRTEERGPREDALYVDGRHRQPQPTLTPLLTEETTEQRKGCHLNTSPGLRSPSPKDTGGASAHREGNSAADRSLLCVTHEKDAPVSMSCNTTRPLGLTSVKGTFFPKAGMDKCSCHLSYASCFHGPDNDLDYECVDSAHSISSRPLTTPPVAGSLSFLDQAPPRTRDESNCVAAEPSVSENSPWPESHPEALGQLQERAGKLSADFSPFLANVAELRAIVRQFSGNRMKHPRDTCAEHYSEHKQVLCAESRKLMASCQKVLQPDRPSEELPGALQETFQDLMRLTALCFQFTACGLCGRRHKELTVNLKDVVCTYHQFVCAALQTGGKGCHNLSATLLARQGTALTAAVFCLTQQFRAAPAM
ncbi:FERM and PDZ domain-containing protein 1 [Gopherus flavomarginatus]|uniref:FERM and PDZ domain-containing protein 1 n=1 Tax=Gopherus flavomarginatus TaxID=286002 RepID=UPI0021CBE339|nr:FERM and PDZ domain-containing protein 1 [Gopherus flavomarginatus]XP_050798984.1 FERM and PDZ domain-containing protein 1 [Gopherus flavomarginatus]XP_050798986.1 FERM and PDZ domain-containing protein 1 [Gopherus flavomarginatus]XP_050798987.1 FERM and PDZ domain-containing protein 1 [Gopherus flavomarginatus]